MSSTLPCTPTATRTLSHSMETLSSPTETDTVAWPLSDVDTVHPGAGHRCYALLVEGPLQVVADLLVFVGHETG